MKHYKRTLVIITIVFALSLLGGFFLTHTDQIASNDIVKINDIRRTVEEHWERPDELASFDFDTPFLVLDRTNRQVYATQPSEISSADEAVRNNLTTVPLTDRNVMLGTLVLLDSPDRAYIVFQERIFMVLAAEMALMILFLIIYGYYIDRTVLRPFRNLKDFAAQIALGNLNVALPREEKNPFGDFTESFDIMREELAKAGMREYEIKMQEKELIASLSHDIKTPITGIKLVCELLKVKVQDPGELEKIDSIHQKADQIDALISDLFATTMDEIGQMQVRLSDENAAILKEIVKRNDDRGLTVTSEIPACLICIDPRRMEQVIANILKNSYKYANTKINIDYSLQSGYLQMEIRDHGPGVTDTELPLLTQKFFRGSSEMVRSQDGSGLGLYIAKVLIEKMNGEILLRNADPGFLVRLLIPLS